MPNSSPQKSNAAAIISIVSLATMMIVFVVVAAFDADHSSREILVLMVPGILSTIPSVFAAVKSERASNDIRNGVLKRKVAEALKENNIVVAEEQADVAKTLKEENDHG